MSRRKWAALLAPVTAAALLLSACGGSSGGGSDKGVQGGAGQGAGVNDINPMDVSKLKDGGELQVAAGRAAEQLELQRARRHRR